MPDVSHRGTMGSIPDGTTGGISQATFDAEVAARIAGDAAEAAARVAGDAAEAALRAAADVSAAARLTALEAAVPVSGTAMSRFINIRDYIDEVVAGDWTPAFAAALLDVTALGAPGIFVPGHTDPYTCKRPAVQTPSIAISERTNFVLMGEGYRSVIQMMAMDAAGASWDLIRVFKNSSNITIRDLVLDGNKANITNLDTGEQTHCLKIGAGFTIASGDLRAGYARNVKVYNVLFRDPDGDCIILSGAGTFTQGADVSDVDIVNCRMQGADRNAVSVQKGVRRHRVINCTFSDIDNCTVDHEPTGAATNDAPTEFKMALCTDEDSNSDSTRVSISGLSSVVPPSQMYGAIVVENHIGGKIGGVDMANALIANNVINHGTVNTEATITLRGRVTGVSLTGNKITRPLGAPPAPLIQVVGQGGYYPSGVDILFNTCDQYTDGGAGTAFIISVENSDYVRIHGNTVNNRYAGLVYTANAATDRLTIPAHGLTSGRGPCRLFNSGGAAPTGLSTSTNYFVGVVDADTVELAASSSDILVATSSAVGANSLTAASLTMTVNFHAGFQLRDSAGTFHPIVSNTATVFTLSSGLTPAAGQFTVCHPVLFSSNGTGTNSLHVRLTAGILVGTASRATTSCEVTSNTVVGNLGGSTMLYGIAATATDFTVSGLSLVGNKVFGATNRYFLDKSGAGGYANPPLIHGDGGDSMATVISGISTIGPVQIGGISGGIADYINVGTPEGVVTAPPGSTCRNVSGGSNTTFYVKETGTGNTGWVVGQARITSGTGDPETVVTATVGTLFLRTDGGVGSTLYIKESGSGNTGWTAV